MQKTDVVPDWFIEIIVAWGAWASGSPVNLKPRSFWQKSSERTFLVTQADIDRMEKSVLELRVVNFPLSEVFEFKYKTYNPRTFFEVERYFRVSNAAARQYVLAAECSIFAIYSAIRQAA